MVKITPIKMLMWNLVSHPPLPLGWVSCKSQSKIAKEIVFTSLLCINDGGLSQRCACFAKDRQAPDTAEFYDYLLN